jgi:hypothetical protein
MALENIIKDKNMDEILQKALDFSNYNQILNIQKKILREKLDLKLTYGHAGGIFKIDRSLISFVQLLVDNGRTENVPLIDFNNNPILIPDLNEFRDEIFDRYFSSTLEYLNEYEKIKKSRTVNKLVDL